MKYHGPGSPGGVAQAFKLLERGLAAARRRTARPSDARSIIRTAFGGPGARDAIELVTRAVTGDRYVVDQSLARPERGRAMERFVFELTYRDRSATLIVREGIVPDEFIALARTDPRTAEQEERFAQLKLDMVEHVMSLPRRRGLRPRLSALHDRSRTSHHARGYRHTAAEVFGGQRERRDRDDDGNESAARAWDRRARCGG